MDETLEKSVSIGIDFGMTYSSMAYTGIQLSGYGIPIPKTKIATDKTSTRVEHHFIPSDVCAYLENDKIKWAVGSDARIKARELGQDAHLYRNYKLLIGDAFLDKEYQSETNPKLLKVLNNITPDQVAQKVVEYLYFLAFGSEEAELYGYGINSVSVSVPALWPERKKRHVAQLVEEALKPVIIENIRIIEEPIAALYHQIRPEAHLLEGPEKQVLVVDYGGGTCDIAVVRIEKDASRLQGESKKVAHVTGRSSREKGGIQIDETLEKYLREFIEKADLAFHPQSVWYAIEAEKMKISFANQMRDLRGNSDNKKLKYQLAIDGRETFAVSMTEDEFSELIEPEISFISQLVIDALDYANDLEKREGNAKLTIADIQHVFLAGGTNLLLIIKDYIRKMLNLGNSSAKISDIDPRKAIVYGAALHAFYNDTGMGIGIGLTLQDDIWLRDVFGRGILIATKGQSIPLRYKHSVRTVKRKMTEIDVAIFRGSSKFMKRNLSIEQVIFQLSKPAGFWTEFVLDVTIDESGLMDFVIKRTGHIEDTFKVKRMVPYRADTQEIAERAEYILEETK